MMEKMLRFCSLNCQEPQSSLMLKHELVKHQKLPKIAQIKKKKTYHHPTFSNLPTPLCNKIQSPRPPASTKPSLRNWVQKVFQLSPWSKSVGFCFSVLRCFCRYNIKLDGFRMFSIFGKIQHISTCVSCRNESGSLSKRVETTQESHIYT